ncbi:hypothetical protein [Salimicrobium halophilum]|uniref:5,10-methylene-tetrahydrofolate dehydrogenase n=1 Tax=Salimicrobium halophilum TaxID=86666 RepID=A0A1G8U0B8_9BACI|nr:hypothetical protein [Salimicrobium halophilum]SDJ46450.1 hypothetical protein SAMN04490247_2037 [Salimicrobium halophilum]
MENRITVGIVTAPGYANKIGEGLHYALPSLLQEYISSDVEWDVDYIYSPLTGYTEEKDEVLEALMDMKEENGWDMALTLTDLPLFNGRKLVVAEANGTEDVGMISIPGLGASPLIKRIRESVLQLISEIYEGSGQEERNRVQKKVGEMDGRKSEKRNAFELIRKRGFDRLSPIEREAPEEGENSEVRFTVQSRIRGALRLITGMVRANRPWMLFPAFMKVVILAFTTGTFALIFPTLWRLTNSYNLWRLIMINGIAIMLLVFWIIAAHKMWERKSDHSNSYMRKLYNSTTFLTLFTTVSFYYTILFLCFQVIVFVLLPKEFVAGEMNGTMKTESYFFIAWTATSISTIISALGSTIEDENVVLSGTYGNRQRQRYELMKEAEKEKKEAAEEKREAAREKEKAVREQEEAEKEKEYVTGKDSA